MVFCFEHIKRFSANEIFCSFVRGWVVWKCTRTHTHARTRACAKVGKYVCMREGVSFEGNRVFKLLLLCPTFFATTSKMIQLIGEKRESEGETEKETKRERK